MSNTTLKDDNKELYKEGAVPMQRLSTVEAGVEAERISTGIGGLDECLADSDSGKKGMPLGVSVLLSGMPGGGKSTLATVFSAQAGAGSSLYLTGEERNTRVKARWDRLKLTGCDPWIAPLRATEDALDCIRQVKPVITVIDSLQCLTLGGKRGHANQFEGAEMIAGQATSGGGIAVMVCHVSKTGQDHAGAAALGHLVDVWLHVTANAKKGERMLEVRKNRLGRAGFQVPVHIGISSINVGTPAPLTGDGLAGAHGPLDTAKEKAWDMLTTPDPKTGEMQTLNFYDFDRAGCVPGIWRIGLELAVKSLQRDGAEIEEFKLKGRRSFRLISLPTKVALGPSDDHVGMNGSSVIVPGNDAFPIELT